MVACGSVGLPCCGEDHPCSEGKCDPNKNICQPVSSANCGTLSNAVPYATVYTSKCTASLIEDQVCECGIGATVVADGIAGINVNPDMKKLGYPSYQGIDITWQGSYPDYMCQGKWEKNESDSHFGRASYYCTKAPPSSV